MDEYRTKVPLSRDTDYWFVEMGPLPDMPDWHMELYAHQSYPFPTEAAAMTFAYRQANEYPGRKVSVRMPDGDIYDLTTTAKESA